MITTISQQHTLFACYQTDYFLCCQEMELSVLQVFNWDVFAITPFDFVDHILGHLPLGDDTVVVRVRHHTITFVALCTHGQ
jgi:hypothetical protein